MNRQKPEDNRIWTLIIRMISLASLLLLVACQGITFPWLNSSGQQPTTTQSPGNTLTPPLPVETQTATPELPPSSLTIWLPPELDPDADTPSAKLMREQLDRFSTSHGDIEITIRLKDSTGPAGLLDALTATKVAAPGALPDLIALNRKDLETAALKSLVYPIDSLSKLIEDADWFPYAKELGLIQGAYYGVPFSGDALGLVAGDAYPSPLFNSWDALFDSGLNLAFAADDPQSQLVLAMYQAAGGPVMDNQRRPMLEADILAEVFSILSQAESLGSLNEISLTLQNESQVWQALIDGKVDAGIVPISRYLQLQNETLNLGQIPPINNQSVVSGSGWVWAVATPQPARQALAVQLAEDLVSSDFLGEWSEAARFLPTRISALESWQPTDDKLILTQLSLTNQLRPDVDILNSLGFVLRTAVLQVLQGQMDPLQAARVAQENLQ